MEHAAFGRTGPETINHLMEHEDVGARGKRHARFDKEERGVPSVARASQAGGTPSGHCYSRNSKLLFLANMFGKKGENKTLRGTRIPLATSIPKFVPGNDQAKGLPMP